MDAPWQEIPLADRYQLMYAKTKGFRGIMVFLKELEAKRYKQYIRIFLRQYQTAQDCPTCHGAKLQSEALQVRIAGRTIADASDLPIERLVPWLETLAISRLRAADRGEHSRRGAQPLALPARRRARLPDAESRDAHALGRRGAAHRARELARLEARGHALRAR